MKLMMIISNITKMQLYSEILMDA